MRYLDDILAGNIEAKEQDESQAVYAPKIAKQDAMIDWNRSAGDLERLVRAYNPVPGAWFDLDGQRIKCWKASRVDDVDDDPGTVIAGHGRGVLVACGEGGLSLESLQRPGKRRVTGAEFSSAVDLSGRKLGANA